MKVIETGDTELISKPQLNREDIGLSAESLTRMKTLKNEITILNNERNANVDLSRNTLPFVNDKSRIRDQQSAASSKRVFIETKLNINKKMRTLIEEMEQQPGVNKDAFNDLYSKELDILNFEIDLGNVDLFMANAKIQEIYGFPLLPY